MRDDEASELEYVRQYVERRQRETRLPVRIDELMSRLMSRRGYAQLLATDDLRGTWKAAVGSQLAGQTRCGNMRRGVLFVVVANSAIMHELMFQKKRLIRQLNEKLDKSKITDLRFRVGAIE